MLKLYLARLWTHAWSRVFEDTAAQLVGWLFRAKQHTMRFTTRRTITIVARVRLMAALLAVVSSLSVLIDVWVIEPAIPQNLALVRTLCAVAFVAVVVMAQGAHTLRDAHHALFFLFAVPATFHLFAHLHVLQLDAGGVLDRVSAGSGYFPIVMLAALSLFPLTVLESASLAIFLLAVDLVASVSYFSGIDWHGFLGSLWVSLLVGTIGMLAGLSQLAYLMIVVREALRDGLTGAYSRRPGEEFLDLQFIWCKRTGNPLALALMETDQMQELNNQFGYVAGDAALVGITQKLNDSLRAGDTLIRWTGKQYLLVFPCAAADQAAGVLGRLLAAGLGSRPDGKPLTTSIGLVERIHDAAEDWWRLIDLAESRIAIAQRAGGNRTVEPEAHPEVLLEAPGST
jgi:diguanylate cyclase (GGDEF)-like protein